MPGAGVDGKGVNLRTDRPIAQRAMLRGPASPEGDPRSRRESVGYTLVLSRCGVLPRLWRMNPWTDGGLAPAVTRSRTAFLPTEAELARAARARNGTSVTRTKHNGQPFVTQAKPMM